MANGKQIGQYNVPEAGLMYRLFETVGRDGHRYWHMEKCDSTGQKIASYNIHDRTCGECGATLTVCNCNSFFWKGDCKHLDMFRQIMAEIEKAVKASDDPSGDPDRRESRGSGRESDPVHEDDEAS